MKAFSAILNILSWFFNPERYKVRRKESQIGEIKVWEDKLAKALKENDTKAVSIARATLKNLRDKYKISG